MMERHRIKNDTPTALRLDQFIPMKVEGLSRGRCRKLISQGAVYINKKRCAVSSRMVRPGSVVTVFHSTEKTHSGGNSHKNAERENIVNIQSRILFEDKDLIVLNKPSGMPSQSTIDNNRENLEMLVRRFLAEREGLSTQDIYLALHHRLDRDTSGVILFTKTRTLNKAITDAFRDRTVQKEYVAVVEGVFPDGRMVIENRLSEGPNKRGAYLCVDKGGRSAITEVERLQVFEKNGKPFSIVRAFPKTGRSHQIRVHLASKRFPIIGDYLYGAQEKGFSRTFLHAQKLQICGREFLAPLPLEFIAAGKIGIK